MIFLYGENLIKFNLQYMNMKTYDLKIHTSMEICVLHGYSFRILLINLLHYKYIYLLSGYLLGETELNNENHKHNS